MAKATPVFKTKFGAVSVVGFERESEKYGTSVSYGLNKSWKDDKGEWQAQNFYFRNATEMLNTIQAIQSALDYHYRKDEVKTEEP